MNKISKLILGLILLFGLMSMSDIKQGKSTKVITPTLELTCSSVYTICDNYVNYLNINGNLSYELEFTYFSNCMTASGC